MKATVKWKHKQLFVSANGRTVPQIWNWTYHLWLKQCHILISLHLQAKCLSWRKLSRYEGPDGGEWLATCPGRFTPCNEQSPVVQEAGWTPEPACKSGENLADNGTRSPDHPARRVSLYPLSYPGPNLHICTVHQWRVKHFIIQQMHKYIICRYN